MDGLRFACVPGCTNCCRQHGYVYITEADLCRAAKHLGIGPKAFEAKYVYRTRHLLRLRKPRNSQCYFLFEGGCRIHQSKPTQCRLYPFWPELVERRTAWKQAAAVCPGIGSGPLVQIGTAMESAAQMRTAYPTLYQDETPA